MLLLLLQSSHLGFVSHAPMHFVGAAVAEAEASLVERDLRSLDREEVVRISEAGSIVTRGLDSLPIAGHSLLVVHIVLDLVLSLGVHIDRLSHLLCEHRRRDRRVVDEPVGSHHPSGVHHGRGERWPSSDGVRHVAVPLTSVRIHSLDDGGDHVIAVLTHHVRVLVKVGAFRDLVLIHHHGSFLEVGSASIGGLPGLIGVDAPKVLRRCHFSVPGEAPSLNRAFVGGGLSLAMGCLGRCHRLVQAAVLQLRNETALLLDSGLGGLIHEQVTDRILVLRVH